MKVEETILECFNCDGEIKAKSMSLTEDGPEIIQLPLGAWTACITVDYEDEEEEGEPEAVYACSHKCAGELLTGLEVEEEDEEDEPGTTVQ